LDDHSSRGLKSPGFSDHRNKKGKIESHKTNQCTDDDITACNKKMEKLGLKPSQHIIVLSPNMANPDTAISN